MFCAISQRQFTYLRCNSRRLMLWPWWRHQIETFSALLAICAGNSPVPGEFPHNGQWRGALMFTLICVWINGWVNNHEAGDLRRYRVHYDAIVMTLAKHNDLLVGFKEGKALTISADVVSIVPRLIAECTIFYLRYVYKYGNPPVTQSPGKQINYIMKTYLLRRNVVST